MEDKFNLQGIASADSDESVPPEIADEQPVRHFIPDETASNNLTTSNVPIIRRVTASPRQVKTQIAKVSYQTKQKVVKPENTDNNILVKKVTVGSIIRNSQIELTKKEFSKKRDERDKEVEALKVVLKKVTRTPGEIPSPDVDESQKNLLLKSDTTEVTPLPRSKTEVYDENSQETQSTWRESTRSVKEQKRSKSCPQSQTKTHELLSSGSCSKRKTYNVEDVRKLIEEQKRRNRSKQAKASFNTQQVNTVFEKEKIRERLEALRKNSRAIVSKNVKRNTARNRNSIAKIINKNPANDTSKSDTDSITKLCNIENKNSSANEWKPKENSKKLNNFEGAELINENKANQFINSVTQTENKIILNERDNIDQNKSTNVINSDTQTDNRLNQEAAEPSSKIESIQTDSIIALKENDAEPQEHLTTNLKHKRIGLLRKPELKDHSFSAIKDFSFEKESTVLSTPKPAVSNDATQDSKLELVENKIPGEIPQKCNKLTKLEKSSKIVKKDHSPQIECNDTLDLKGRNDLPYWLKPCAVQVYPYNFIMAVRRKLEAITNTRESQSEKYAKTMYVEENSLTSASKLELLESNQKNRDLCKDDYSEDCFASHTVAELVSPLNFQSNKHKPQTVSEISTNITSISIDIVNSKTDTDESLLKVQNKSKSYNNKVASQSGDDTTISSSVFSNSIKNMCDEKLGSREEFDKLMSLSLEPVQHLQLTSNQNLHETIALQYVNCERGDSTRTYKIEHHNNENQLLQKDEQNFNKLLDDFNESLSQVIQVNEQLKTTLCKSHHLINTEQKTLKLEQPNEYTSDFEEVSSQTVDIDTQKGKISEEANQDIMIINENQLVGDVQNLNSLSVKSSHGSDLVSPNLNLKLQSLTFTNICSGNSIENRTTNNKNTDNADVITLSKDYYTDNQRLQQNWQNNQINYVEDNNNENQELTTKAPEHTKHQKKSPRKCGEFPSTHSVYKQQFHISSKSAHLQNDVINQLNQSGFDLSTASSQNDIISESSCSYSSVGFYEKLIREETTKSEQLTILLKMKEKALFDRTKGQIAWLELQKERCKSKGLLEKISAIRKKQRGILMKMEDEREEIKRLLKSAAATTSTESSESYHRHDLSPSQDVQTKSFAIVKGFSGKNFDNGRTLITQSKHSKSARSSSRYHANEETIRSVPILRANYELESSKSLEELLLKREADLRHRRKHVERLMQWHQRLDKEEKNLLEMERALLNYNYINKFDGHKNVLREQIHNYETEAVSPTHLTKAQSAHDKMERRIQEIDRSLRELNNISNTNSIATSNKESSDEESESSDLVSTSGNKLNKLWRRLTAQQIEKFDSKRQYKLRKNDLERLYKEAKTTVQHDYARKEKELASEALEINVNDNQESPETSSSNSLVPPLNLSSDPEDESSRLSPTLPRYSPSTPEADLSILNNLKLIPDKKFANASEKVLTTQIIPSKTYERDIKHLCDNSRLLERNVGLSRSLSDTQITNLPQKLQLSTPITENMYHNVDFEANRGKQLAQSNEKCYQTSTTKGSNYETKSINDDKTLIPLTELNDEGTSKNSVEANNKLKSLTNSTIRSNMELHTSKTEAVKTDPITEDSKIKIYYNTIREGSTFNGRKIELFRKISDESNTENISQNCIEGFNAKKSSYDKGSEFESNVNFQNSSSFVNSADVQGFDEDATIYDSDAPTPDLGISKGTAQENTEDAFKGRVEPDHQQNMLQNDDDLTASNMEISSETTSSEDSHLPVEGSSVANNSIANSSSQLMPDIINEVELRRCQQILLESDHVQQNEHATVPYMYVREIPNKPPPPYVPPAHGSPMTTIFPSEERIKDITYRRTHELYSEILNIDYVDIMGEKLQSVLDEKITNIYERIIVDICREYLQENQEVLTQGDPVNFHSPLAFFNPPDRLICIQETVYKEVRRCLAMDKTPSKRTNIYSMYGQRAKRDHIGKIIIQETYDEDKNWCNFHKEEIEVLEFVIYEMIGNFIGNLAKEVLIEEGGEIEEQCEENTENILTDSNESGSSSKEEIFGDTENMSPVLKDSESRNKQIDSIVENILSTSNDSELNTKKKTDNCTENISSGSESTSKVIVSRSVNTSTTLHDSKSIIKEKISTALNNCQSNTKEEIFNPTDSILPV